jgi:AmmeMemoRadiSam system protein B
MKIRPCAYAGSFYPADPDSLLRTLEYFFSHCNEHRSAQISEKVYGIVSPHAGYIYSGQIAAIAFYALGNKKNKREDFTGTIIIIGPGHRSPYSAISSCEWETPLGNITSNELFAKKISRVSDIAINEQVHLPEHGIEVILPFVKYQFPNAQIVAIQLGDQRLESSRALGEAIASCTADSGKKLGEDVYIIASSDGSHYISDNEAKKTDTETLSALSDLDCYEFYKRVKHTTMCGYGPTIAMVTAAQMCGAKQGICLAYKTSGDITGDHRQVVGYAAVAVV